jgi:hypothetical protein
MQLDIRLPIGIMFAILGALLTVYGLAADPGVFRVSLGINIDLVWGAVLLVFGGSFVYYGRRAMTRP